jgi:membrane protein DedA with SNARE-associated domain
MPFDLRALADWFGYPAAGLGILIESSGIPFPGGATLLLVAAYAAAGHLDLRLVVVIGALGGILGADLGYLAGYRGGRPFVERFSHLLHVNSGNLARSEMFFTRYGGTTILFARFVLGLRTWASLLAGMSRMPFWTFQLYSSAGSLGWALIIGGLGLYLGSNWSLVQDLIRAMGLGGLLAVALLTLVLLLLRRRASHI